MSDDHEINALRQCATQMEEAVRLVVVELVGFTKVGKDTSNGKYLIKFRHLTEMESLSRLIIIRIYRSCLTVLMLFNLKFTVIFHTY